MGEQSRPAGGWSIGDSGGGRADLPPPRPEERIDAPPRGGPPDGGPPDGGPPGGRSWAPPGHAEQSIGPSPRTPLVAGMPQFPSPTPDPSDGPRRATSGWPQRIAAVLGALVLAGAMTGVATLTRGDVDPGPGPGPAPVVTVAPPEDAETSRRQIAVSFGLAFDPEVDQETWLAHVAAVPATGERLRAFGETCGAAVPVVDSIDFTSADSAVVRFRFEGSDVPGADTVVIEGTAQRTPPGWKVTTDTIERVIQLGTPFCGDG